MVVSRYVTAADTRRHSSQMETTRLPFSKSARTLIHSTHRVPDVPDGGCAYNGAALVQRLAAEELGEVDLVAEDGALLDPVDVFDYLEGKNYVNLTFSIVKEYKIIKCLLTCSLESPAIRSLL